MDKPLETFREGRLNQLKKALARNNFEPYVVSGAGAARTLVLEQLLPKMMEEEHVKSASFGGSMTLVHSGIYEGIKALGGLEVLDTYDTSIPRYEVLNLRRKALLSDVFLTSANAITEDGRLVNLDGTGNRVAALAFGPRFVIVVAGRNKVVPDLDAAFARVRNHAAPVNSMRLDRKTPCVKTLRCENCTSPERICNTWSITEKAWPKNRIKVILVDQELGF
ncbi:MAG: lactate utilization protein [Proteobacteria bacterium]|nr:lactate utilization protein [Pseudomonadota bacterium]